MHDLSQQHTVVGRGVGDGVRACRDGLANSLILRAAGGDDGDLGMAGAERGDELRRLRRGGNVQNVNACGNTSLSVLRGGDDGRHDRNVDVRLDVAQNIRRNGRVEHNAVSAAVLSLHRLGDRARARREAAADAAEHGHIRHADDGAHDARLRGKGINGNHRIGIDACDGGNVSGKDKGLDRSAEDADAAALVDALGYHQHMVAELSAVTRRGRRGKIAHKSTFLSAGNR